MPRPYNYRPPPPAIQACHGGDNLKLETWNLKRKAGNLKRKAGNLKLET